MFTVFHCKTTEDEEFFNLAVDFGGENFDTKSHAHIRFCPTVSFETSKEAVDHGMNIAAMFGYEVIDISFEDIRE